MGVLFWLGDFCSALSTDDLSISLFNVPSPPLLPVCDPFFCSDQSCPIGASCAGTSTSAALCFPPTPTHPGSWAHKWEVKWRGEREIKWNKSHLSLTNPSDFAINIEMSSPTFKLNFFIFSNTEQNKHCLEARSPGGKSNVQRLRYFFFFYLIFCYQVAFLFDFEVVPPLGSSVLFDLKLLLPGFIQVNQSLVVEDKQNEVQRVCGDADDAEVL